MNKEGNIKKINFLFFLVTRDEVEKETEELDTSKSQRFNDIPTKIVKDTRDLFSNFINRSFNSGISTSRFPTALKILQLGLYLKTIQGLIKQIIDRSVCYQ